MSTGNLFRNPVAFLIWAVGDVYFIASVLISLLFAILAPNMQQQLQLTNAQLGLLGAVFFLSYAVAQFFAGRLFDHYQPRYILSGSALMASGGLMLLAGASNFFIVVMAKLLIGIGLSTAYVGVIYLAKTWFTAQQFTLLCGITQMSSNVTAALVVLGLAISGIWLNFRTIIGILAILIFLIASVMIIVIRSAPTRPLSPQQAPVRIWQDLAKLARIRQFWLGAVYFGASFSVLLALSDLWNIPTQLAYRHSQDTAAILNAMFPLGGGFGAIAASGLSHYFRCPATIARCYSSAMLGLTLVLVYGPEFSTSMTSLLIFGLGFAFGGAILGFPLVSQYLPVYLVGTGFGLMATIAYLWSALLQYLVGILLGDQAVTAGIVAIHAFQWALTPLVITLLIGWLVSYALNNRNVSPKI
ncbi:MAG: MFS transporter [Legionellales bacterium]|nr:MFS transporter [Legionellales bacterium]